MFAPWHATDWDSGCVDQTGAEGLHKHPVMVPAAMGVASGQITGLGGLMMMMMPDVANVSLPGAAAPPSLYINTNTSNNNNHNNLMDVSGMPTIVIPADARKVQTKRPRPDDDNGASGLLNSICSSSSGAVTGHSQHHPSVRRADRQDHQGGLATVLRHHLLDLDALVTAHMEKVRAEELQARRRLAARLAAAADAAVARRVRQKQDEIDRIGQVNAALEERVRRLAAGSMAWRDIARANEDSAVALRRELEAARCRQQVPLSQEEEANGGGRGIEMVGPPAGDDAEESCCGNDAGSQADRCCRDCGEVQAVVVLLPCRHLCLCSGCASRAQACPVCSCAKHSTVHVNLPPPSSSSPSIPS